MSFQRDTKIGILHLLPLMIGQKKSCWKHQPVDCPLAKHFYPLTSRFQQAFFAHGWNCWNGVCVHHMPFGKRFHLLANNSCRSVYTKYQSTQHNTQLLHSMLYTCMIVLLQAIGVCDWKSFTYFLNLPFVRTNPCQGKVSLYALKITERIWLTI